LTYTEPATGAASQRYFYDTTRPGSDVVRTVNVTDQLTVEVNVPGNQIFDNTVYALERLGRSLLGYSSTPAAGQPDGGGTAYTAAQYTQQTDDIQNAINLLTDAREQDIMPERVQVASKMRRLDTAEALLQLTQTNAEDLLAKLQQVDVAEAATNLSQAQTALQASYTVSTRILNLSILDFI
jgi:flagellar hook-associated protein 3 FlgL